MKPHQKYIQETDHCSETMGPGCSAPHQPHKLTSGPVCTCPWATWSNVIILGSSIPPRWVITNCVQNLHNMLVFNWLHGTLKACTVQLASEGWRSHLPQDSYASGSELNRKCSLLCERLACVVIMPWHTQVFFGVTSSLRFEWKEGPTYLSSTYAGMLGIPNELFLILPTSLPLREGEEGRVSLSNECSISVLPCLLCLSLHSELTGVWLSPLPWLFSKYLSWSICP